MYEVESLRDARISQMRKEIQLAKDGPVLSRDDEIMKLRKEIRLLKSKNNALRYSHQLIRDALNHLGE
jgi:hypothetical protein